MNTPPVRSVIKNAYWAGDQISSIWVGVGGGEVSSNSENSEEEYQKGIQQIEKKILLERSHARTHIHSNTHK